MIPHPCSHCGEPVALGDESVEHLGDVVHRECGMRMAVGSLAHQMRRCTCAGSTGEVRRDPPRGMTARHAARLAYAYWMVRLDVRPWARPRRSISD